MRWSEMVRSRRRGVERDGGRKVRRGWSGGKGWVSARKLAAALWRLQAPDVVADGSADEAERRCPWKEEDRLGFMHRTSPLADRLPSNHGSKGLGSEAKEQPRSPCCVNGPINGYIWEPQTSFKLSNYAMEGASKWDPVFQKNFKDPSNPHLPSAKLNAISTVSGASTLQSELDLVRTRIEELELEQKSSKKKLEHFLRKLGEEREAWRSREHVKVRAIIDDIKADLKRERKSRQRLEIVNSKLVNELAEAKLVVKRYMQDHSKERKARDILEDVCDELAKEIGEDKAEVEVLKKECSKIREEVDDERKMLQMAEVWREERVQTKLVDAKVTLEDKNSQMNKLIADLERFLKSKSGALDPKEVKEMEWLTQAVASGNIHDMEELSYEHPKSNDNSSAFEEIAVGETSESEVGPWSTHSPPSHSFKTHTMSPKINMLKGDNIYRHSNIYGSQNGNIDDDRSEWETVSDDDNQGTCYSPEESSASVNKILHLSSNVSGTGTEWEENEGDETPTSRISEVRSVPSKQSKKVSSITRLWRTGSNSGDKTISVGGMRGRLFKGKISNGSGIMCPDRGSRRSVHTSVDLISHWCSLDTGNPQIGGGMKGCIEWPQGQTNSLEEKLLEARMESRKIQIRQVLEQNI